MVPPHRSRYVVTMRRPSATRLADLLAAEPGVQLLRVTPPDVAVVEMTGTVAEALTRSHPEISVELDVRHRPA